MSKRVALRLYSVRGGERRVEVDVERVVCAGFSGRNQEAVRKHIEELRELGVPTPDKTPTYYLVAPYLLFTDEEQRIYEVKGDETSAEVEFAAIVGEKTYITVGSDHTDRWLEKVSIERAKHTCPKIISSAVWDYEEVKDHWDSISLRCFVKESSEWRVYQDGSLAQLLPLDTLIREFNIGRGSVLFSGTIPTVGGKIIYGREYRLELDDQILGRKITLTYTVSPIWP